MEVSFDFDRIDVDSLNRLVGQNFGLGYVSQAENLSGDLTKGDFLHVIFHGSDKNLAARVITEMSGEKWKVRVYMKEIY
jgi:hypothetical protein